MTGKKKTKETVVDHGYIEPDIRKLAVPIADLKHDPHQSRTHSDRSIEEIKKSLKEHGQKTPIVIDSDRVVKKGNGTLTAAQQLGWTHLAAVRSSDSDKELRKYAIRDNRTAEFAEWMASQVLGEIRELEIDPVDVGWYEDEYQALSGMAEAGGFDGAGGGSGDGKDEQYSTRIEAPIYKPTGVKPPINELYDTTKVNKLARSIRDSKVPDSVKTFLLAAAQRHTVFNYHKIADYYAESPPEVQRLMEESALVIIDFNRAIELGHVRLNDEIAAQYAEDHANADA